MRGQPTIRNGKSVSEHTKQSQHQPDPWRLEAGDRAFLFVRCAAPAEKDGLILQMDSTGCGFYCEFDESAALHRPLTKVNFLPTFGRVLIFQNAKKQKPAVGRTAPISRSRGFLCAASTISTKIRTFTCFVCQRMLRLTQFGRSGNC